MILNENLHFAKGSFVWGLASDSFVIFQKEILIRSDVPLGFAFYSGADVQ
jgi:hypothetical protein